MKREEKNQNGTKKGPRKGTKWDKEGTKKTTPKNHIGIQKCQNGTKKGTKKSNLDQKIPKRRTMQGPKRDLKLDFKWGQI